MSENESHGDFKFLVGLFIGGLIGAFVIFFMGTNEGKRVKRELKERGEEIFDGVTDKVADIAEQGEELVEKGEKAVRDVAGKVEEKKEVITEVTTEKLDTALAQIEQLQAQGQQTTAELRKHLVTFKNLPPKRR